MRIEHDLVICHRHSIAACARWEERYIVEWLNYYRAIGFDHVFLYCNDDDPAPLFARIEPFTTGEKPFVTFRHHAPQGQQREMYLDFLTNYAHLSEWFGFFDIDEFLRLAPGQTIGGFLAPFADDVGAVLFNWVFFGPNGHKTPPDLPVLEAFTRRQAFLHQNTKFLMRSAALPGSLDGLDLGGHPFWHRPNPLIGEDFGIVNAVGEDARTYYDGFPDAPLTFINEEPRLAQIFATALIHHYAFRSEQAFAERAARGTMGSFAGQGIWKDLSEGEGFAGFLSAINSVEDFSLADFWRGQGRLSASGGAVVGGFVKADEADLTLLSNHQAATQSSRSAWSRGETVAEDAEGALDGVIDGRAGFHTAYEDSPWWRVDLGAIVSVAEVRLYNRLDQPDVAGRSSRLVLEVATDDLSWSEVFRRDEAAAFGGVDGHPLIIRFGPPISTRFVRVRLLGSNFLHLDQVQIFGPAPMLDKAVIVAEAPEKQIFADIGEPDRAVLSRFQSIGNNCEFGSVQKSLGIGKLSLLQWTESSPEKIIAALGQNFSVFTDRPDIGILEDRGEYFWYDPVYGLKSHSFIRVVDMTPEAFVQTITSRNRF